MWVCCCVAPSLAGAGEGREEQEGRGALTQATREMIAQGWGPRVTGTRVRGVQSPRGGPRGTAHSGRTHSMIRETCSLTGTLRSLKAVVMKQPKVSAAITLSEKANREFARDRTVFIVMTFPPEPRLPHPYFRLRFPRPTSPSHPRTRYGAHVPGARPAAPPPFRSFDGSAHAPHHHWDTPTAQLCTRWKAVLSANPPISREHEGWVLPRGPASSTAQLFFGFWLGNRGQCFASSPSVFRDCGFCGSHCQNPWSQLTSIKADKVGRF